MSREINFLNERRKQLSKQERGDRSVMMMSTYFVVGIFVLFLLTFGLRLYLERQLFLIQEAQKVARNQITSNEEVEKSFVVFIHKLSHLAKIYRDRQEKKSVIQYFTGVFGDEVSISEISFNQAEKLLTFTLTARDVFNLKRIFDLANSEEMRIRFKSVNLSNLSRNQAGQYSLILTVSTDAPKIGTTQPAPTPPATQ